MESTEVTNQMESGYFRVSIAMEKHHDHGNS